jgi:hypothetical protein
MSTKYISIALVAVLAAMAGCNGVKKNNGQKTTAQNNQQVVVYEAHLQPLNSKVTGMSTTGEARFVIADDTMTVTIDVKDAPPNMQHWQHFHGFKNDSMAVSPPSSADRNGDGIIDVAETEPYSGTTMVPFNADPAAMNVGANTYPQAGADSSYHYEVIIPIAQLKAGFAKVFGDTLLDLDKRVLYIHGVPANTRLPKTVASVGNIPAQITLPIACGQIVKVSQ